MGASQFNWRHSTSRNGDDAVAGNALLRLLMTRLRNDQWGHPATLVDVGRAAGVSITAASSVLNHASLRCCVSPETRKRIIAAAAELQYRPNAAAQALANHRIRTFGVVTVVESGEFSDDFIEVFNGILVATTCHRQNTTVFALPDWSGSAARLHDFCDGRVDGLILLAPTFDQTQVALPEHVPIVSIHANRDVPGVVNVESHEEGGAYALVCHLIALGHRRIMHLTGPPGLIGAERRIRGYQRALADAGVPFNPQLLVTAGYTTQLGREATCCWLLRHSGEPLPHAVFCANDASAVGCLEALARIGLRVPDDVSVAGFGDTLTARVVVPQLTSVHQPLAEMGARAVELLLAQVDERDVATNAAPPSVVFPMDLVRRASVGTPPISERVVPAQCRSIVTH